MTFVGKLKIELHSGKGLKDVKNFGIMSPYAIIYIVRADGTAETEHISNTAKKGNSDPLWDYSVVFNNVSINENCNLVIKIKHGGTLFDRKVGKVKVPFKDLLAGDYSGDKISYQVTSKAGQTQGIIVLSHSFTEVVPRSGNEEGASTSNVVADGGSRKKKDGKAKMMAKKVITGLVGIGGAIGVTIASDKIEDELDIL